MDTSDRSDPFKVLGMTKDATEEELRARYLELVKQYPPEREPEKFREIHAAFEAAKDPLVVAIKLLKPPDDDAPGWLEAIEAEKDNYPPLSPELILSLGNREGGDSPEASSEADQTRRQESV